MLRYKTEYPNQLHQLSVSVSKHYHVLKAGIVKYQAKNFDVNLSNMDKSAKEHLIHYIIRDHCSGLFYYEIATSKSVMRLEEFLFRAWSQKSDYAFCGIPELMSFPKTVSSAFPGVRDKVASLGISLPEMESGFKSGISDVSTVEKLMGYVIDKSLPEAQQFAKRIAIFRAVDISRNNVDKKIDLWRNHVREITMPPAEWADKIT